MLLSCTNPVKSKICRKLRRDPPQASISLRYIYVAAQIVYLSAMVVAIWPVTAGLVLGMLFISTVIGTFGPAGAVMGT
jgi:hypothetical protein